MIVQAGEKLLFVGDSITDAERNRPARYHHSEGLGTGYVALANAMIQSAYPERKVLVMNAGISGNQVVDLEARWQTDVLDKKPDWLSIMIGINDVWRQFQNPDGDPLVLKPQFESVLRKLVEQTRPSLKGLILMTPYLIEPSRADPMRAMMDKYGAVVNALADESDAVFVDTQAAIDSYLQHRTSEELCDDRIHPNMTGHMIIAKAFAESVGI